MGRLIGDQPAFGKAQQPKLSLPPMEPEVVTDMVVYLCGPSGRYLTGVALPIDGGLTLR
jgi:NAD(P)-dependent dehydrogenase (short-subunit alcohol dehydrogenase family)